METRKHLKATKKVSNAVYTFEKASVEVDKAVVLIEESIKADEKRLDELDMERLAIDLAYDTIVATTIAKRGEIKRHVELSLRLKEFTL